jgi:hypothetical protein
VSQLSAVLRDLPAKTKVDKIYIKAVNFAGLTSESNKLEFEQGEAEVIETKESSRHAVIMREYDRCLKSKAQFIDTDFFTGFMQPQLRVDFMKLLEEELVKVQPDEVETREAMELNAIREFERLQAEEDQKSRGDKDDESFPDEVAGDAEENQKIEKHTFTSGATTSKFVSLAWRKSSHLSSKSDIRSIRSGLV